MVDTLKQEMATDVEDLKAYSAIWQRFKKDTVGAQIKWYNLSSREAFHSDIDARKTLPEVAAKLKAYTEEDVTTMRKLQGDPEWSKDLAGIDREKDLLASLANNPSFLGQWLDFLYKETDAEMTEKIRDLKVKIHTLHDYGRKALEMNLV